ncbi:MAG: hypothetical protein EAZ53_13085 [Bacteroidetes bacterium]|nr:MAG: hypothetical protein EAZ53_13085 [Bacteroidota bacterium]
MIKILDNLPCSGEYEEIFFEFNGLGQNWCYVLFTTSIGEKWVGHFRAENHINFKVADLTLKNIACIVSGGHGYIVDIDKKSKLADLKQDMILDLSADEKTNSFYISTYWSLTRVDENFNEIDIDLPIGIDGVYFTNKVDRKLFLKLEEIGADFTTSYDYYIDLDKQKIEQKH